MSERVDTIETLPGPLAESLEPGIGGVGGHGSSVPSGKEKVTVNPLVPQTETLFGLNRLVSSQNGEYLRWQVQHTGTFLRLWRGQITPFLFGVLQSLMDGQDTIIEVKVLPFKTQQFPTTQAAINCQHTKGALLRGGIF